MGELARLAIYRFTKEGLLFGGVDSELLRTRGQFFTKYVSEIESDKAGHYTNCMQVLDELGLQNVSEQDCANVRYICECVSSRAAHLVSAGIAALINKMDEPSVTVIYCNRSVELLIFIQFKFTVVRWASTVRCIVFIPNFMI